MNIVIYITIGNLSGQVSAESSEIPSKNCHEPREKRFVRWTCSSFGDQRPRFPPPHPNWAIIKEETPIIKKKNDDHKTTLLGARYSLPDCVDTKPPALKCNFNRKKFSAC